MLDEDLAVPNAKPDDHSTFCNLWCHFKLKFLFIKDHCLRLDKLLAAGEVTAFFAKKKAVVLRPYLQGRGLKCSC